MEKVIKLVINEIQYYRTRKSPAFMCNIADAIRRRGEISSREAEEFVYSIHLHKPSNAANSPEWVENQAWWSGYAYDLRLDFLNRLLTDI